MTSKLPISKIKETSQNKLVENMHHCILILTLKL